jgi:hypothetical protein
MRPPQAFPGARRTSLVLSPTGETAHKSTVRLGLDKNRGVAHDAMDLAHRSGPGVGYRQCEAKRSTSDGGARALE